MELQVLNPVANIVKGEKTAIAPRLVSLTNKTIGLYWNGKPGGTSLLEHTTALLKQRYANIEFRNYVGMVGAAMRQMTSEQADTISKECDAVISATAD
jgi:hypothetical protein